MCSSDLPRPLPVSSRRTRCCRGCAHRRCRSFPVRPDSFRSRLSPGRFFVREQYRQRQIADSFAGALSQWGESCKDFVDLLIAKLQVSHNVDTAAPGGVSSSSMFRRPPPAEGSGADGGHAGADNVLLRSRWTCSDSEKDGRPGRGGGDRKSVVGGKILDERGGRII